LVSIKVLAQERGYFPLGLVTVFTRYPLGLLHAWAILNLDMKVLVYPAPLGQSLLPASSLQEVMGESTLQSGSGEDFLGYRAYQLGDSPRHIAWKVEAREQGTFIKQFGGTGSPMLWLDWKQVSHLASIETALSQLALWVVLADKQGACYGLRLPDVEITPSHGDQHVVYKPLPCLEKTHEYFSPLTQPTVATVRAKSGGLAAFSSHSLVGEWHFCTAGDVAIFIRL
jgi:uncharacterized protein (DUF58 family)